MYNIAVLVHNFSVEYADLILQGVYRFFSDKNDVRVFFCQTYSPHLANGLYDYQFWAGAEYLKSKCIDEVIVVSNTYCLYKSRDELKELFRPFFTKKFVSIGMNLEEAGLYYTTANCDSVYDEVVGHLKNEHGCTKIGFFAASQIQSQEGEERFQAYKKALEKHGLEFHEEWVLSGAFTKTSSMAELQSKFKKKEDIKFEAILCANDLMGMAVLDYAAELGINVPAELKVFGFDNTSHSILSIPALSTIDQSIEDQGYAAAEFGYKLLEEKDGDFPQSVNTELKAVYRRSCGCEDYQEQKKRDVFRAAMSHYEEERRITNLFDVIKGTASLSDFAQSFKSIVGSSGFSKLVVFALKEPVELLQNDDFKTPEVARILLNVDTASDVAEYYEDSDFINLKDTLFATNKMNMEAGCYIFQPVMLGTLQYGYIFCKAVRTDFGMSSIVLKIITSVIVQAYDYTITMKQKSLLESLNKELQARNLDLSISSKTDELTKLLNRRGFMEYGQKLIFFSEEVETDGIVFFADLDGLKAINDNHGHEYGDRAIQTAAEVLRTTFRKMDVIGRLSGDEFGIIASGMDFVFLDKLREKIDTLCAEATERNHFPFKLSMSIGAAIFTPQYKDLNELLMIADQDLYDQKKLHHAKLQN